MKQQHLRTVRFLVACLKRLTNIEQNSDLPDLHRLSVDLLNYLPQSVAHEYSSLFLEALRVTTVDKIPAYATHLREKLNDLVDYYRARARTGK